VESGNRTSSLGTDEERPRRRGSGAGLGEAQSGILMPGLAMQELSPEIRMSGPTAEDLPPRIQMSGVGMEAADTGILYVGYPHADDGPQDLICGVSPRSEFRSRFEGRLRTRTDPTTKLRGRSRPRRGGTSRFRGRSSSVLIGVSGSRDAFPSWRNRAYAIQGPGNPLPRDELHDSASELAREPTYDQNLGLESVHGAARQPDSGLEALHAASRH